MIHAPSAEPRGTRPSGVALTAAALAFLLLLAALPGATSQAALLTHATAVAESGDFAGLVDIGGRRLWLECRGTGSPTVVLEAGAYNNAQIWDTVGRPAGATGPAVLPGVAAFTRVCAYDRPGTMLDLDLDLVSRSDPVPMPRTAADMVADLHALLEAAGVPGPYVLVGHSFGGLIARLYASTYPNAIAGLILVDAAQEDYYDELQAILSPEQWAANSQPPDTSQYPDMERIDTDASAAQMRTAATLPPLPLVVLTHGRPWDWPPGYPADTLEALWGQLQAKLVALVPNARFVMATGSQHFIQLDEPELVIEQIRQVVDTVRDPST